MTKEGPAPVATLDPYRRVEAETIAEAQGVETEAAGGKPGNQALCDLDAEDHLRIRNVDFGSRSPRTFAASIAREKGADALIEVRLDRVDGPLVATLAIPEKAAPWKTILADVGDARGVRDLFLVFKGAPGALKIDWWKFER